jgi:alpha-beta hydrolase superfamily lysophospholipase
LRDEYEPSEISLRRIEGRFRGADGHSLFRRSWRPPHPERAVVLVHGFGEHSGRYEQLARWLAQRGCAVHAYDQRGHGRTPGRRGHAARFGLLIDDLEIFVRVVREDHPGQPVHLVGHSMGGLVVATAACERRLDVDSLVTSGAALTLSPDLSAAKLALAKLLARIWPTLSMEAGIDPEALSRDPEVVRAYVVDPLVSGRVSAAFIAGMIATQQRTAASAHQVAKPILLLHGGHDRLCLPEGSERFAAEVPGQRKAVICYPELRHEIFNEPEREKVFEDLLGWVTMHEQGGRGVVAAAKRGT